MLSLLAATIAVALCFTSAQNLTSNCPGYTLDGLTETPYGLSANLSLAGEACNVFGDDIANLTIQVSYETETRLHVLIVDQANQQYTIPESVISRPPLTSGNAKGGSDLVFNYNPSPFEFWITRRSEPDTAPLFDTRGSSLPATPVGPIIPNDNSTTLETFSLVFEKQYLQVTSALPRDTNIYGLGEVVASSGFRRNLVDGGGSIQTFWNRDIPDPVDQNLYGSHPMYLEHRIDKSTGVARSHGVFLLNAAGGDVLLLTPQNANTSLVQYRMIGGVLDFYFFSGPDPKSVTEQYGALIGLPTWQPAWAFGFHLCRYGYKDINETKSQVEQMKAANIPLEVMWNDIDLYHGFRDFTTDPVNYPVQEVQAFIKDLTANHKRYIPIVDAAIAKPANSSDVYDPYTNGVERDVFIKNPDGSEYVGQVWPGNTVFPDWLATNSQQWWTDALKNWSRSGVEFSGIWLDMNEASSFCDGSCGSATSKTNTQTSSSIRPRGNGAGGESGVDLNNPPYAIHNGFGRLSPHGIATNATHVGGVVDLDVHNLFGLMEEKATHAALKEVLPGKRPFIISRSTFASSGKWTGHWLGDNFSQWAYLRYSLAGVLQFQLFQIPMVGADSCGFLQDTTEELCNRWMQFSAFTPFYRNHNVAGALSQEPYRWESVANASRTAIAVRYSMLPYWYTLFANASLYGTPPVRALFWEFPAEQELYNISTQLMIGSDILVTPVFDQGATTVQGIFPGRGNVTWRDWYTHEAINASVGAPTTLSAPLGHINVHIRDGAALLLHAKPGYTIYETQQGPYSLLVSQGKDGHALGTAYIDDGISDPPGPSRTVKFAAQAGSLAISGEGSFVVEQQVQEITVLGVGSKPSEVAVNGESKEGWDYQASLQKLVIGNLTLSLNEQGLVQWKL